MGYKIREILGNACPIIYIHILHTHICCHKAWLYETLIYSSHLRGFDSNSKVILKKLKGKVENEALGDKCHLT